MSQFLIFNVPGGKAIHVVVRGTNIPFMFTVQDCPLHHMTSLYVKVQTQFVCLGYLSLANV